MGGIAICLFCFLFFFAKKCKTRKSRFRLIFCFNLAPVRRRCNEIGYPRGFSQMQRKCDILVFLNTNSRRLIRIWRSWGLIPSRNRKQGVDMRIIYLSLLLLILYYYPFYYHHYYYYYICFAKSRCQCTSRNSGFRLNFRLIFHQ